MRSFRKVNDNSHGRNYPTNEAPLLQSELQNLDRELQILKRQREIIFKQRQVENQLLSQRLNSFNQPSSSSFGRPEPKQNYYTNNSASYSNLSNSKGYKRPSERSYNHPPPKQARSNDWGDEHDNKQPSKPQPLMNIPTQQYKKVTKPFPNNKPKPFEPRGNIPSNRPQKDFHTGLPKTKLNKMSDKSVAPVGKNTPPGIKKKGYTSDDVLRPDVLPNPSVNGRLELALGELLKHIRTSQLLSEDQKKQLTGGGMRSVKSILRQRISTVMMNRKVGSMVEIVAQYKKTYPKDVDDEIIEAIGKTVVNIKKEKTHIKNISITETERIHMFFKSRVNTLLKRNIQNMIDNLLKMYGDNEAEILKCLKDLPELEEEKEKEGQKKDRATDVEIVENYGNEVDKDNTQENIVESDEKIADNNPAADKDNTQENIVESDEKIADNNPAADKDNTKENIVESDEKIADNNPADVEMVGNNANNDNAQENVAASTENTAKNTHADVTIDLTNAENDGSEEKSAVQTDENQAEINNKRSKLKQYYKLMDLLIENRLPKLLLNFKDEFAKIMYCEKDFIIGKEMIMRELKETLRKSLHAANNVDKEPIATVEAGKASTLNQGPDSITPVKESNNNAPEEMDVANQNKSDQQVNKQNVVIPSPQTIQKGSQLYVMLLGRPSLPSKAEIYDFLNKFNPKSIKKHKTVNNLLVIGFENKQDYDKILEANQTEVGNATFIIKANEVITSDKQKEKITTDNNDSAVKNVSSQKTEEINKATEENAGEKETDRIENDNDVRESEEKMIDETIVNNEGQAEEKIEENMGKNESTIQEITKTDEKSTVINDVNKSSTEVTDVNNEVTEITDKRNEENVLADKNKESPNANDNVDDKTEENVKDTNENVTENTDKTDEVRNLETIQESEETEKEVKGKTRAAAVATPTRSSSRLANTTPSTIKTRRTSRLAQ